MIKITAVLEEITDLRAAYPADPEPAEDENWTK